jgi:hypothetical protein
MAQEEPEFYLTGQVVATYIQVRLTPQDFGRPRRGGISQSSTCICLPAEASAQAGAFLISLQKKTFSTGSICLKSGTLSHRKRNNSSEFGVFSSELFLRSEKSELRVSFWSISSPLFFNLKSEI